MPEFLKRLFRTGEQKASPKKVLDYAGMRHTVEKMDNRYASKKDVPYKFKSMTQSEYDSLWTKDSNTVYLIIG